jgi:hypothetical protein
MQVKFFERRKGFYQEQGSNGLPEFGLGLGSFPQELKGLITSLNELIGMKSQQHELSQHSGQILFAVAVVMLKVVALVLERIERLVLNLPAASTHQHEVLEVLVVDLQVGHPAEAGGFAAFVGLLVAQHVHPKVGIRVIEGQVVEILETMSDVFVGSLVTFTRSLWSKAVNKLLLPSGLMASM